MNVREWSLGKVSVVQMARAAFSQASWDEERLAYATWIPSRILVMGRLYDIYQHMHFILYTQWTSKLPLPNYTSTHHQSTRLPMLSTSISINHLAHHLGILQARFPGNRIRTSRIDHH